MDANEKKCGPKKEVAKNGHYRISRCSCGTLHLEFERLGMSVQLSEEQFRELGGAVDGARAAIRALATCAEPPPNIN